MNVTHAVRRVGQNETAWLQLLPAVRGRKGLSDQQSDSRRVRSRAINTVGCLGEILLRSQKDVVDPFLGIAVDEREPGGLNLDHEPMSRLESMEDVL